MIVVVADSSPLIALERIGRIELMKALFEEVLVPPAVAAEVAPRLVLPPWIRESTMVKAGVYILVRLAPIFQATFAGYVLAFIGALTFLIASGIAISQSNAKRVLAYSTIANLGLIVACAGIGTSEAIWAAILLIIFHAISKSLLFLAVGSVEHKIESRDIEDMNGLIMRMPKVAAMMVIGIAGMFSPRLVC